MKNFKEILSLLLVLVLLISITGCGTQNETKEKTQKESQSTISQAVDSQKSNLQDGTFTGEGEGKGGLIKVDVTIKDGKISKVDVTEHHETEGLCDTPIQEVIDSAIANNTANVDTVSGATLTTQGLINAIKAALISAGATDSSLNQTHATSKTDAKTTETEQTYDVVIIGGGGAGLTAAIEAKNAGASVVLLEKMSFVGGNTLISGAELAASGNWLQKEEGIKDSIERHFEDTMKGGDYKNDEKLVRKLVTNALQTAEWLRDYVGVEFEDHLFLFGGHTAKRSLVPKGASGVELVKKLKAKADELQIPIELSTRAIELITDENKKVVGVKAQNKAEQELTFHANKSVIIATGGFGANVEMRTRFNPKYDDKFLTTNHPGATGDGLTMAEAIGAKLFETEYIQTYPICDPLSGRLLYVDDARFISTIIINKEGKRFVEELGRRDEISEGIASQTGACAYELWDQNITEISKIKENHKAEMDYLYKNNLLAKVDSIKEAAEFFDIDVDEFEKTVTRYNEFAKNGKDEDFNKRGTIIPMEQPPYYILKAVPAIHHTMGGIKIDEDAHVLSQDGTIIEGLYAAGEVTGGVHGTNRLGSNAIADITVFGRIAGKNAAE